jgi:hypothetical protein
MQQDWEGRASRSAAATCRQKLRSHSWVTLDQQP